MPETLDAQIEAPGVVIETGNLAWRPSDRRTRCEWGEQYVEPPNSARQSKFSRAATPWLAEPIDWSADNRVKQQVCLMPTGAGKTTLIDVLAPHAIVEDPGPMLLILQTDPDAREYVEERLMPILRRAEPVRHILAGMDRHAIRKDAVMFPHMAFYMNGAKLTAMQRRSVRYAIGDEVWRWAHGYVAELEKRLHDRWNGKSILLSQGGTTHLEGNGEVETELETRWKRTDRREWSFECPQCREVQRYRWKGLLYEREAEVSGDVDETAIFESARYQCIGATREKVTCDAVFPDTLQIRRQLANSGRYVIQNPRHLTGHHGWHCNALTLFFVPWGQLAVEHAQAHRARKTGDEAPLRIFRQKRGAENHRREEQVQMTALTLGDYSLADYLDGQRWEGEVLRGMHVDVQRDHYRVIIRVWRPGSESRRIYRGRINTEEQLRDLQKRFGVSDKWVTLDSGEGRQTDRIYNLCGRFGWTAFKGDHADGYLHIRNGKRVWKYFSARKTVVGSEGKPCALFLFSNLHVKRVLERLRNGPQPLGDGSFTEVPRWEVEKEIDDEAQRELFSETERDQRSKLGKVSRAFVPVSSKRANHDWDCEVAAVVCALGANVLAYHPPPEPAASAGQPAPQP